MAILIDHITISNLNRPVTINKFLYGQDDSGGNIKMLDESYSLMADVQQISNNYVLEQLQTKYGEGYRITLRYEPSRLLNPNDEIVYGGNIHKIQSIRTLEEAAKRFVVLNTSIGNSISNGDGGSVVVPLNEYHWVAEGDEFTVQADEVRGWTGMILLFRDKVQFRVIRSGTPTAIQALYDMDAGTFTFSNLIIPLAPGETVDAYHIHA